MVSEPTLLPCPTPWCARNDEVYPEEREGGFIRYSCDGCGVKGPTSTSEEAAAKLWNTRMTAARPVDDDAERVIIAMDKTEAASDNGLTAHELGELARAAITALSGGGR